MKKLFVLLFALAVAVAAPAQSYVLDMENLLGTNLTRDTVTNTGTGVLVTDRKIVGPGTVTIVILVTKVSGTVAGSIVLTGSIDGTNYVAVNTVGTQTAITAVTATDATARYEINLSHSPFLYYKITHTGSGTMVSYLDAVLMKH